MKTLMRLRRGTYSLGKSYWHGRANVESEYSANSKLTRRCDGHDLLNVLKVFMSLDDWTDIVILQARLNKGNASKVGLWKGFVSEPAADPRTTHYYAAILSNIARDSRTSSCQKICVDGPNSYQSLLSEGRIRDCRRDELRRSRHGQTEPGPSKIMDPLSLSTGNFGWCFSLLRVRRVFEQISSAGFCHLGEVTY
ncbi:hypothetical protein Landi51_04711 [Colletotrichum acutatum]